MESAYLPDSAKHFDRLPDSARIDIAAVIAVVGKSRATIYRWVDRGLFPKPRKLAGPTSQNTWSVADVRRALSGE
jgi:predicted DNA-binding transcriptional regulator AlpA